MGVNGLGWKQGGNPQKVVQSWVVSRVSLQGMHRDLSCTAVASSSKGGFGDTPPPALRSGAGDLLAGRGTPKHQHFPEPGAVAAMQGAALPTPPPRGLCRTSFVTWLRAQSHQVEETWTEPGTG